MSDVPCGHRGEKTVTDQFQWLNEPPTWQANGPDRLSLTTGDRTDFWQHTFYGFHRDDGHAYLQAVQGDFTASAIVNGAYKHLYDQAGLMLRIDALGEDRHRIHRRPHAFQRGGDARGFGLVGHPAA
jgi:hypothetical protein